VHTWFGWGNLRARDHLEEFGINFSMILKWIFNKWDEETWIGLIWLKIRIRGGGALVNAVMNLRVT
jgi:hypothetical protein